MVIIFCGFFLSSVKASTQVPVDITTMSIKEIQDAFDKGYLSSELLVKLYLERIEEYDNLFNSINTLNPQAIEEAKKLDQERLNGHIRGRLHGIPILVKTNIDVKGLPTTGGTKALSDNYPKENAFVIQRLIDEGAIILGSTNMSEMAFLAYNSYSSYGHVKNVFNILYSPYGSSGGSAVSLGASFAAATLGTDTNSSVRVPAAAAGVIGLRPTYGRVSRSGVIPYDTERDTVGIMSKTVEDNALIMDVISGKDSKDSATALATSYDYGSYDSDYSPEKIRIGVITSFFKGTSSSVLVNQFTDEDIYNLSETILNKLKDNNVELVYIDDFMNANYVYIANNTKAGITMCDNFNLYIEGTTGTIRSFEELVASKKYVQNLQSYLPGCGGNYGDTKEQRDSKKDIFRNHVDKIMDEYDIDVIAYPVFKNKIQRYKETGLNSPSSIMSSVIGYPAITLPMGKIDEFSYGIEFLAKANQEDVLFNIAGTYERIIDYGTINSPLTPSLYEIPNAVQDLKKIYETGMFDGKDGASLQKEIRVFFENYAQNGDVEGSAKLLIEKYNKYEKGKSNKFVSILIIIIKVIGILFLLFILYFIYRLVRRFFKRLR